MSDFQNAPQENLPQKNSGVKSYLSFLDNNVLFKKPVSCLFAILSLLAPILFLVMAIQGGAFDEGTRVVIATILAFIVLTFAGIVCSLLWWHRRINRDEGPKFYDNLRRFLQTLGEFCATFIAINVFGLTLIQMLGDVGLGDIGIGAGITEALMGPVIGFVIIIVTKIILFLLDPVIWVLKQIWRFIKYIFRNGIKIGKAVEEYTPAWVGITWLFGIAVVIAGLRVGGIASALIVAFGLAFLSFLIYKKKRYIDESDEDED